MKKALSLLLTALLVFGLCAAAFAASENGATAAYRVTAASDSDYKIELIRMIPATGADGEAAFAEAGEDMPYVEAGQPYYFKVETVGGYAFDQTTQIRVYPASSYYADLMNDTVDPEYGTALTPDENGVYTIDAVNEDLVVAAVNLQQGSLSWVKDFILDLLNFFKNLTRWLFGLR